MLWEASGTYRAKIDPSTSPQTPPPHPQDNLPSEEKVSQRSTGKNNGFPFLDILGYFKEYP